MVNRFRDRTEAGRQLAAQLKTYANRGDVLVLGLPRGGVPVAYEVALALNLPLDICLVRKLGVPWNKELAIGAIASGGVRVLNEHLIRELNISEVVLDQITTQEQQELDRREKAFRGDRPPPQICDRTILLVDDGLATGATMRAAIQVLRAQHPQKIVVAVPISPISACEALETEVDEVISLKKYEPFYAIGHWYINFSQVPDKQVRKLLARQSSISPQAH